MGIAVGGDLSSMAVSVAITYIKTGAILCDCHRDVTEMYILRQIIQKNYYDPNSRFISTLHNDQRAGPFKVLIYNRQLSQRNNCKFSIVACISTLTVYINGWLNNR